MTVGESSKAVVLTLQSEILAKYPYLNKLYSENVLAKIWGVAEPALKERSYPSSVPDCSFNRYVNTTCDDWTAGFFPGSLYALLERAEKYPDMYYGSEFVNKMKLHFASEWWASYLYPQQFRKDIHDLSFIMQPALRREYELYKNKKAYEALVNAGNSLAKRFDENVGLIRSWNRSLNKRYDIGSENDYMVIIDNMMNLDMLFWVASKTGNLELSTIAFRHAEKTLQHHIRKSNWSTYHLVVYDPKTGLPKAKLTNQGYNDESCWSRGQAWGITGFAQTYCWTGDKRFLEASINLAKYFLSRLSDDGTPAWDFDAPTSHIKDVSAGMIAAKGFLILHKETGDEFYLDRALFIVNGCIETSLATAASFRADGTVDFGKEDTILINSTQNNNEHAFVLNHSHGLVYADYYFLEFGNSLLEMGMFE